VPKTSPHTFIDLFAGIGGFRLGFESAGCRCVWASEWNKFAQETYQANFGDMPAGDIRKVSSDQIPRHEILTAGFPCQPFSISGVSKRKSLNMPVGFDDETQGTLFFEIKRIIKDKRPKAFLLENVKHLQTHDKGRTFKVIVKSLSDDLGYSVHYKVIDAALVVPQHRERIFIVGFDNGRQFNLDPYMFPEIPDLQPKLRDILERSVDKKYTLTDHLWQYLQDYADKHRKAGHGFGYGIANRDGVTRTLSARYHKDGSEILIPQKGKNPRRLTPRECARLLGFPDTFKIPVSDTQAYHQFGNAVSPKIVEYLAVSIVKYLDRLTAK